MADHPRSQATSASASDLGRERPSVVSGKAEHGLGDAGGADLARLIGNLERKLDQMSRRVDTLAASMEAVRRSQAVYLGDHVACTYLHNGWRIFVDTRSFDVGIHLLFGGRWEPMHSRVFERMLFKGAGVLDVGANQGYYSVLAGPVIGPTGLLIAIEPNPHLARLVHNSFSINGFLRFGEVHNVAVADRATGVVDLWVHPHLQGAAQIKPAQSLVGDARSGAHAVHRVPVSTIDALLGPERLGRVNVVKMDIEGAEALAFAGMTELLRAARPLRMLLEFNGQSADVVAGFRELMPVLEAEDFAPLRVVHEGLLESMTWEDVFAGGVRLDIVVARRDDHGWISVA